GSCGLAAPTYSTGRCGGEFTTFGPGGRGGYGLAMVGLACPDIDESRQEERGQDVEKPVLAPGFSGDEVQNGPGNNAEAKSVGDGVGERDEHQGEEGWDGDQRLVPADFGDGGQH